MTYILSSLIINKIYHNTVSIAVFINTTSTWRKILLKDDIYITVRLAKLLTWIVKLEWVRQLVRHTLASYPFAAVTQCTWDHSEVSGRQKISHSQNWHKVIHNSLGKNWLTEIYFTQSKAPSFAIKLSQIWLHEERKLLHSRKFDCIKRESYYTPAYLVAQREKVMVTNPFLHFSKA